MASSTKTLAGTKFLAQNGVTLSSLAAEHLFKMAAAGVEFWASLETNFSG